jgi:hypothetical protein
MLRNTRKATLNRIGTQRKKRGYKGGASYTYMKWLGGVKHTTCGDVDGGGVKRLVGVPVHRGHRHDVDVGAVLLGTNKARENRNPNTHVNI